MTARQHHSSILAAAAAALQQRGGGGGSFAAVRWRQRRLWLQRRRLPAWPRRQQLCGSAVLEVAAVQRKVRGQRGGGGGGRGGGSGNAAVAERGDYIYVHRIFYP